MSIDLQRFEKMLKKPLLKMVPSVIYPNGTHSRIFKDEEGSYRIDDLFGLELEFYSLKEIELLAENDLFPEFEGITIGLRKNPRWQDDALLAWARSI